MKSEKITVEVKYVGHEPFADIVPSATTLQSIKVHAMKSFSLEPDASEKYTLQYEGADIADNRHVGDFGKESVVLALTLNQDVNKG